MKTLNNCTPREFMRQLSRIREASRAWLDLTQLQQLRRRMPAGTAYKDDDERIRAIMTQWRTNVKDMLNAALVEHPEETIELMGLLCFIEPEDLDNHDMSELFAGVLDVLNNDKLLELFTVLLSVFTPRIMAVATAPTTGEAAAEATSVATAPTTGEAAAEGTSVATAPTTGEAAAEGTSVATAPTTGEAGAEGTSVATAATDPELTPA